ncbi:MAG: zinc protease [Blastocatellia bacterium]|jgi:predicted Zn-dependent peptidase|nr:zinc protease [Blastocatellia bacterium]
MKGTTIMKSRLLAAAISIAALTSGTYAQQGGMASQTPSSTKGAVIKGKAPVNKNLLKVKLPKAREATLKNGLHVVVLESKNKLPIFSMEMVVMSGGLSDPSDMHGLANATALLMREGTAKHNSREFSEQLDTIGATLNANSGVSSSTSNVSTSGLVDNLDQILDLFTEVIRTPKFPTEEVERYKSRAISQQPLLRGQPQFLAQERLNQAIYGTHPGALIVAPADSLKKITSTDLIRFHDQNYVPNNATLFIAGDVTLAQMLPKLERAFGDWKPGTVTALSLPAVPAQGATRIHLINRPGSVQTVFSIGSLGIERTDPDYIALSVMNRILGTGPSSRLFLNIREDKGYAYSVSSSFSATRYRGTFVASSPVRTEVTEGTIREFMNEFKRIRDEKVSATELENAKRAIIGSFALSLENPQARLQNIITQKLYNLPANYWDTYPQKVEALTVDDVQRVAQKYIDVNHLQIVAVGDANKTRAVLAKFGTVQEYDSDGKPVRNAAVKQ